MSLTRAYRIVHKEYDSYVVAGAQCAMTGIYCPECTQWGDVGVWYPTVDCAIMSALDEEIAKYVKYTSSRGAWKPMNIDEYKKLAARLIPILGEDRPVKPGTGFGPMEGKVDGEIGDFAWHSSFLPLVRESIFKEIRNSGFPVIGAPAKLKFKKDPGEMLIQLELRPTARLASSVQQCDMCGRITNVDQPIKIDGLSFDDSIPIQNIHDCTNVAVVSAAFADFIAERKLTDITLTPIEVV